MKYYKPIFRKEIQAPPCKSIAIRAFLASVLSEKPCRIYINGMCDDTLTALDALRVFGPEIITDSCGITLVPPAVLPGTPCTVPDFRDCATALRLYLPVMNYLWGDVPYKASDRLLERVRGTLTAPENILRYVTTVDASVSSQTLSGLLFAKALSGGGVKTVGKTVSLPYIRLTLDVISSFTGKPYSDISDIGSYVHGRFTGTDSYTVEGDWSGAAYLLVAGAIGKSPVSVTGLKHDSLQGDRAILSILQNMGADITTGDGKITSRPSALRSAELDVSDCPDLVPPLAAACAAAVGTSVFYGADRLRTKESDRISSICLMISEAGGKARFENGNLYIHGPLTGGHLTSSRDHRITMAQILLSLISEQPVYIDDCSSIVKSYPDFCETFINSN